MTVLSDIKRFFRQSSLNILLLQKIMEEKNIPQNTISKIAADLIDTLNQESKYFNSETLSRVFSKYNLGQLTEEVYEELSKDPMVLPYGAIGCF